jgi:hypothetical protein
VRTQGPGRDWSWLAIVPSCAALSPFNVTAVLVGRVLRRLSFSSSGQTSTVPLFLSSD